MSAVAKPSKWLCCQLGARMHYAIPRLLHASGRLDRFYTDIYAGIGGGLHLLSILPEKYRPGGIRRLLGRAALDIPGSRIRSYPLLGLAYYLRRKLAGDLEAMDRAHFWAGKTFGEMVVRGGFREADAVYAFNTAGLEVLTAARRSGLFTVLEQTIVPRTLEEKLLADSQARYPGWEAPRLPGAASASALAQREREEWAQADLILCGSEFVREGIRQCGGPVERCRVVPYGVDARFTPRPRRRTGGPLRVLTVGVAGLRKGAGCAMEVAKALHGVAEFRWVGAVGLLQPAREEMAHHIELTGVVARKDILSHYDWADVFFLPSICEGSATATYEALACGLPVVTTPNAGSTIHDGVEGFILPIYDVPGMIDRLRQLQEDPSLLERQSAAALLHAREFSLEVYQKRLLNLFSPLEEECIPSKKWS